ncbi:MAG TPA: hypothetical protein VLV86_19910 [Vicinamibacterales bacterium]|nr:hypothetical protein [Vicinamibacterales bacterium]
MNVEDFHTFPSRRVAGALKIVALSALLVVGVFVAYELLRFGKRASDLVLATLQSAEQTAAHNE